MAADLLEAIADSLHGGAAVVAAFGRSEFVALERAGPDMALPCAVIAEPDGDFTYEANIGGTRPSLKAGVVLLAISATTRAQARSLGRTAMNAIHAADDAGTITFTEGEVMSVRRLSGGITRLEPDPAPDGSDVWTHLVQYRYYLAESETV